MPIYEYRCETCGHEFEKLVSLSAPPPPCPECAAEVRKKVSASSFVLKGSGWYRDHYGLKKDGGDKSDKKGAASDSKPAESKSSDSKPSDKPKASAA